MKHALRVVRWMIGGALLAVGARAERIDFTVNEDIPDNDDRGLQSTGVVTGLPTSIESIDVWLKLSATSGNLAWAGDYYVTLQHESGFSVLLNRAGRTASDALGYDDNGFDVLFTYGGTDIHTYWTATPTLDSAGRLTGTWGVDGRNVDPDSVLDTTPRTDMLAGFSGLDPNGSWTLFVADLNPNGVATLDGWGLDIEAVPEASTLTLVLAIGGSCLAARRLRMRFRRR